MQKSKKYPFPPQGQIELSPSILSADFAHLYKAVRMIQDAGCFWVHCDVMDNHFVPNLTFGAPVIQALHRASPEIFYDVHLMIESPEKWVKHFIEAGADAITFHLEACKDVSRVLQLLKDAGIYAGLSLKPNTPVSDLRPYLPELDFVLVMTVEPGFGGQGMIEACVEKIRDLAQLREANNWHYAIEVDGGIHAQTAADVVQAGADILVAGSAVYNARPVSENIADFSNAIARVGKTLRLHQESGTK